MSEALSERDAIYRAAAFLVGLGHVPSCNAIRHVTGMGSRRVKRLVQAEVDAGSWPTFGEGLRPLPIHGSNHLRRACPGPSYVRNLRARRRGDPAEAEIYRRAEIVRASRYAPGKPPESPAEACRRYLREWRAMRKARERSGGRP